MTTLLLLAAQLALPGPRPAHRLQPATPDARVLLPVVIGGGLVSFLILGRLSLALTVLLVLGTAGWAVRGARLRATRERREARSATFLGYLAGELRAGAGPAPAVEHAAAQLPADAPRELADLLRQAGFLVRQGRSAAPVFSAGPPELRALGALWALSERHGLPLAPLVEQAQQRIDARLRHRTSTTAALQGPQATAVILTLLPLAGIAMGTAMGADPIGLLTGGGLGGLLLLSGTALAAGGFVWSRIIIGRAAP